MRRCDPARRAAFLLAATIAAGPALAQFDGARLYWPLPKNTNVLAVRSMSGKANASWSNWNAVQPGVDIDSDLYVLSYMRVQPVFGRTAYWQAILPAGTLDTSSALPLGAVNDSVDGIADPMIAGTVNLFGKPEMMAKDYARHDQDLSIDFGLNLNVPVGTYHSDEVLNLGSNQWKLRVSAPIVQSLGPWVPGERTTLEVMPFVTLFGDNDNSLGNEIDQDPMFGVEAHLTRDLTRESFLSLDYVWVDGGEATFTSLASGLQVRRTSGLQAQVLGLTAGFAVNDNLRLSVSHMQTISGNGGGFELDGSMTMITLSWSWHDVLQRVRDFRDN